MDNLHQSKVEKRFKSLSLFSQGAGFGIGICVGGYSQKPSTGDCINLTIRS